MRVCGLKPDANTQKQDNGRSHPMRVCGLKLQPSVSIRDKDEVTPYAGVWIETLMQAQTQGHRMSHPMRVCGLKLIF